MKSIAIIQARMSSSRLPGKVIQDIAGKPMLAHVVERAQKAERIKSVWIATTTDSSDDLIEVLCKQSGIPCYRGSMHDVLDRYYQTAIITEAEVIVRLTADCPLLDPVLVDATLEAFSDGADFGTNRLPHPWTRSFPIGLDVEVCSFSALERAWKEAEQTYHREHVMPYLYDGVIFETVDDEPEYGKNYLRRGYSSHGFRIVQLHHNPDYGALRWTVDTPVDLELVREIFSRLGGQPTFSWLDVVALFESDPELVEFNADVQHKSAFDVDSRMNK